MANKMFLKLSGIKGESKAKRHVGEIEILSWAWSGTQRGKMLALGAPQGDLSINLTDDLSLTKARDKSSQALLEACATGKTFDAATVTAELVSDNGNLQKAMIMNLKSVRINSFGTYSAAEDFATLSFEEAKISHSVKD